jgi:hypothetical protein
MNYAAPGMLVVLAAVVLTSGGDDRSQETPWFIVATYVPLAIVGIYLSSTRWGIRVHVEHHLLTWRAPYRRRLVDLREVTVAAQRSSWPGLVTLGCSDGSALTVFVQSGDWARFVEMLGRYQGADVRIDSYIARRWFRFQFPRLSGYYETR